MKSFKTKTGMLTDYALSCGYLQNFELNNRRVCLYKVYNQYFVKNTSNELSHWECFEKLSDARKDFRNEVEKVKVLK